MLPEQKLQHHFTCFESWEYLARLGRRTQINDFKVSWVRLEVTNSNQTQSNNKPPLAY